MMGFIGLLALVAFLFLLVALMRVDNLHHAKKAFEDDRQQLIAEDKCTEAEATVLAQVTWEVYQQEHTYWKCFRRLFPF